MSTDKDDTACTYEISRFGSTITCTCSPESAGKTCQCHGLTNPFLREAPIAVPDHGPVLIAYIRVAGDLASLEEQTCTINDHCLTNGFRVAQFFVDNGKPSYALTEALQAMKAHHGLIAVNLQSFVENTEDRLRDLRPFVHHFFCSGNKDLITVQEGIDTATSQGQIAAEDAVSASGDSFNT
jgi:hypothetical protein